MCSFVFCVNEDEGIKLFNFEKYFLNPETILHMKWHYVSKQTNEKIEINTMTDNFNLPIQWNKATHIRYQASY